MIESRKLLLYVALSAVCLSLWSAWQHDNKPLSRANLTQPSSAESSFDSSSVPQVHTITHEGKPWKQVDRRVSAIPSDRLFHVDTKLLRVDIDKQGGRIVGVKLKAFPESLKDKTKPSTLLSSNPGDFYVAESGLTGDAGSQWSDAKALYKVEREGPHRVVLTWRSPKGLLVKKQFDFQPNSYAVGVNYTLKNQGGQPWAGHVYAQIRQKKPAKKSSGFMRFNTYRGAALFTPEKNYTKLSFKKMKGSNFNRVIKGGWVAIQKQYFLSAWIAGEQNQNHYFSSVAPGEIYTIGFLGPAIKLAAGDTYKTQTKFYAGPEEVKLLEPLAKGLKLTVDYGWLWPVSMLIMWGMRHIYQLIGNWGWAIIAITLLIKLLFFKLSETSYRSMARMRKLQPRMDLLKERYGDDKQAMSKATIELYKKEKVNPMGGCLPFIIQIPVFIALYYVLIESVELRQAPFIFWIHDLSTKDPYFILPVLMGLSMLLQQQLNPAPADPVQAKMMYLLPVVFTVLFLNFPAGLVLYWLVNNCLSVLQQWYITWRIEKVG